MKRVVSDRPVLGEGDPSTEQDLGSGVTLRATWYDSPDVPVGWILSHPNPDGTRCMGSAWLAGSSFATPGHSWTVEAGTPEKPLTLRPSFRCHCGFHGFVTDGKWVGD